MIAYLPFFALLLVPALILLPALRNRTRIAEHSGVEQNAAIASARIQELGNIDDETRKEAETEIKSSLLEDARYHDQLIPSRRIAPRQAVWVLLFLPLFSVLVYLYIGSNELIRTSAESQQADMSGESQDISSLLIRLENQLERQPGNARGWQLAAQSYMVVGQYGKAILAYETLNDLEPGNPDHLAGWADASIMAADNVYTKAAADLIGRALAVDPGHQQALWLSALGASSTGNYQLAVTQLKTLQVQVEDEPEMQQLLQDLITRNQAALDGKPQVAETVQLPGKSIAVRASAESRLVNDLPATATLFVIARAADGPAAPLAVSRHSLDELPLLITLTRAHAMIPDLNIEKFDSVVVLARISLSGNPAASSGDIQSEPVTVQGTASELVNLVINSIVP